MAIRLILICVGAVLLRLLIIAPNVLPVGHYGIQGNAERHRIPVAPCDAAHNCRVIYNP